MTPRHYGSLASGESVEAYTLVNEAGASVEVLTYGGTVTSLCMPDRDAQMGDVVLGFGGLGDYLAGGAYIGAIVGRIAGRVSGGQLSLEGRTYELARNDGPNHLHGGRRGLDKRVWKARPVSRPDGAPSLRLSCLSPDGEEGYPGSIAISVTYTLTSRNEFIVDSEAAADRATPLSMAQHSYFNLAGEGSGKIFGHEVQILADEFVPTDATMTLSNSREPVDGWGADFRSPRRLDEALPTLFNAHGDIYLLRASGAAEPAGPRLAARVSEGTSGRVLQVFTDESCLQFYAGAALDGARVGKSGTRYGPHSGFCMECHGYPNGSRMGGFGDILVHPGQPQRRRTVYAFSIS
jgi:aldose 1-epimerase